MTTRSKVGLSVSVAVLLLVIAWSISGTAQRPAGGGSQNSGSAPATQANTPVTRISVAITHVKPEMVGVYEDAIKNTANPALKKAGVVYRWTWSSFMAGQNYTYVGVQPVANFAQYDQPRPLQRSLGAEGVASYDA